jgi:hypothetical protein
LVTEAASLAVAARVHHALVAAAVAKAGRLAVKAPLERVAAVAAGAAEAVCPAEGLPVERGLVAGVAGVATFRSKAALDLRIPNLRQSAMFREIAGEGWGLCVRVCACVLLHLPAVLRSPRQ